MKYFHNSEDFCFKFSLNFPNINIFFCQFSCSWKKNVSQECELSTAIWLQNTKQINSKWVHYRMAAKDW